MSKYDDAAELNRRVTFQRFTGDRDIVGDYQYQADENWEDVFTVWGSVRTISSREYYAAGQSVGEITHNVRIRKRDGVLPEMRILCQGVRYRPMSPPIEVGDRRYLVIKVAEVV